MIGAVTLEHNLRSIPAWAGKPDIAADGASNADLPEVYPRVGGETTIGMSDTQRGQRSIPAWAGKPRSRTA